MSTVILDSNNRPQTNNSIVESKSKRHFVGHISSKTALKNSQEEDKAEKLNISIEEAIKNIASTNNNRISSSKKEDSPKKVYTKFWSMPNGLDSDKIWKSQRDQRAASEIIASQRRHEEEADEGILRKLRRNQKLSV